MSTPTEPNFETMSVAYDSQRLMWGFPLKDDPNMYLWVSVELMQDVGTLSLRQMIYNHTKQRVTESQIRFLATRDSDINLPVVSRVVFEYPEGK